MSRELGAIKDKSSVVGDVRVNGALIGVELVKDKVTKELFPDRIAVTNLISKVGRDNGVLFSCSPWYGDVIFLLVALTMTDEELGLVFSTLDKAIAEVEKQFR